MPINIFYCQRTGTYQKPHPHPHGHTVVCFLSFVHLPGFGETHLSVLVHTHTPHGFLKLPGSGFEPSLSKWNPPFYTLRLTTLWQGQPKPQVKSNQHCGEQNVWARRQGDFQEQNSSDEKHLRSKHGGGGMASRFQRLMYWQLPRVFPPVLGGQTSSLAVPFLISSCLVPF